jgi:hypothetical protein
MKKSFATLLLSLALANGLFAMEKAPRDAPEINPGTALSALVLLSAVSLVIRDRRKS